MALDSSAVRVAGTGEVYVAPEGTAAPTDSAAALAAAWVGLGHTTTDGVQFNMSRDTTDIDSWQASKIRVVSNSEPITLEFSLMETDAQSFPVIFGGGTVSGTAPEFVFTPPAEGVNVVKSCVVEFRDGDLAYRYYFPRVQVEGDVSFSLTRTDAVAYSVTLGVLAPAAGEPRWKLMTNDTHFDPIAPAASNPAVAAVDPAQIELGQVAGE